MKTDAIAPLLLVLDKYDLTLKEVQGWLNKRRMGVRELRFALNNVLNPKEMSVWSNDEQDKARAEEHLMQVATKVKALFSDRGSPHGGRP